MDFFGDRLMSEIGVIDCERFVSHVKTMKNEKGSEFKPNTIRNHISAMRMLYAAAIKRGVVAHDPWSDVDRKRVVPRGTKRTRVIGLQEQEQVMAKMGDEARRAFIVMLGTGVREDELLRIEPKHCDLDGELLRLTAGVVKGKTRYSDSDEFVREVPMQPAVVQALREQMAAVRQARSAPITGAVKGRSSGT